MPTRPSRSPLRYTADLSSEWVASRRILFKRGFALLLLWSNRKMKYQNSHEFCWLTCLRALRDPFWGTPTADLSSKWVASQRILFKKGFAQTLHYYLYDQIENWKFDIHVNLLTDMPSRPSRSPLRYSCCRSYTEGVSELKPLSFRCWGLKRC